MMVTMMTRKDENDSFAESTLTNTTAANSLSGSDKGDRDRMESDDDDDGGEEDMESLCEELGVLFEGSHATTWKRFSWAMASDGSIFSPSLRCSNSRIHAAVSCVDDEPGAVQSGLYLWPAAQSLCDYLVSEKNEEMVASKARCSDDIMGIRSLLELGAGAALPSLCALQVFQDSLDFLVVTDGDYGTLERARDNYETTMTELYEGAETEEGQESVVNDIASISVEFLPLSWGQGNKQRRQWKDLQKRLHRDHPVLETGSEVTFDLVLGSDLIHSVDMVEPLLQTAKMAMKKNTDTNSKPRFLLSQSFPFDTETEEEIDRVCDWLQLSRHVVEDRMSANGSRIQEFRHVVMV